MPNKPPAFQFYVKDWLSSESVVTMTAEQRGWYIQLLCHAWNGEPIASLPTEDSKLKTLAGAGDNWVTDRQTVLDCFELENARLVNKKLSEQYQELAAYHSKQRENGQKGARSRWKGDGDTNGSTTNSPLANHSSSTSTSTSTSVSKSLSGSEGKRETAGAEQGTATPPATDNSPVSPTGDVAALCELISDYSGNAVKTDWAQYAAAILRSIPLAHLKPLLEWMYLESDFWGKRTFNTKNLFDHLNEGNLQKKYRAVKARQNRKTAKVGGDAAPKTAPGAHGNFSGMKAD
jgi:uncharacterized protein YdaU (DUF1376 family)